MLVMPPVPSSQVTAQNANKTGAVATDGDQRPMWSQRPKPTFHSQVLQVTTLDLPLAGSWFGRAIACGQLHASSRGQEDILLYTGRTLHCFADRGVESGHG